MKLADSHELAHPGFERVRRLTIWAIIIGIIWAPAVVALAMILTGHAGR